MTPESEPRRSTRNKRQTTFYEPASISPATKRVKVDSDSITALSPNPKTFLIKLALSKRAAAIIATDNIAATSDDITTSVATGNSVAISDDNTTTIATGNVAATLSGSTTAIPTGIASTTSIEIAANQYTGLFAKSYAGPAEAGAGTLAAMKKPLPFDNPPAWAEDRQALCETMEYFRAYEGCVYHHSGLCYGILLNFSLPYGQYMDEEVIILRGPGSCAMSNQNIRTQTKSQTPRSALVELFLNNQTQFVSLVVIIGSKHCLSPTVMPHRYNVGAHFHVTAVWAEMNGAHKVFKFRLQKVNLQEKSWWAPQDSPMPPASPDYQTKAPRFVCHTCGEESPQIYKEGWMCVSLKECSEVGKLNGQVPPTGLTFYEAFLNERVAWPASVRPTYQLAPGILADDPLNGFHSTSLAAWKGFVCPDCQRCNSRISWDTEVCATPACKYQRKIVHPVHSHRAVLPPNIMEVHGHATMLDENHEHVQSPTLEFYGHWKIVTFKLCEDNYITHFLANKHINAQAGGANEVFLALQKGDGLGLKRSYMKFSRGRDNILTRHFARNFGMPYDYVAAADSAPFSQAPLVIMSALNRLTWAGDHATKGSPHPPRNELLAVGYMQSMKMGYHDDGEYELDDVVSTWSLGGAGDMLFRIKKRFAHPMISETAYDPTADVVMGSDYWEERTALNALHHPLTMGQYKAEKAELFEKMSAEEKRKTPAPVCLKLHLRHGDFVVMHGANIHTYYEHAVVPSGNLRYGLTARHVHPHLVDASERYRGDFTIDPADVYDGDINLPLAL